MIFHRGRRLRASQALRTFASETEPLHAEDLIMPYFIVETDDSSFAAEIPSMPGQYQLSLSQFEERVRRAVDTGLTAVLLFGIPAHKDTMAHSAYAPDGIIQQAVSRIKGLFPDLLVCTDVCLCEYMSHGHCGILDAHGCVVNDETLPLLAKTAVSHVRAGADMVAPSDMMDGRVVAMREALDDAGFLQTPILSYAVKYASALYGPFRDAAQSAPGSGDRKSYQMDFRNAREALTEALADVAEGADALIVKPAGIYSDILYRVREAVNVPVVAYQVSGEYSMIRAAGLNGWIDEARCVEESLISLKRAGAFRIISYFTESLLAEKRVR